MISLKAKVLSERDGREYINYEGAFDSEREALLTLLENISFPINDADIKVMEAEDNDGEELSTDDIIYEIAEYNDSEMSYCDSIISLELDGRVYIDNEPTSRTVTLTAHK